MKKPQSSQKKLTIFITIDTEDGYFDIPHLITGQGIKGEPGIDKIMALLNKYKFKGNFFTNVYEHIRYSPETLPDIVESICRQGHAVELHSHADKNLSFYQHAIYNYNLQDQIQILQYGVDCLQQWIGIKPTAYRGGSYEFNENTLYALFKLGVPIDSSRWYKKDSNKISKDFTINKVAPYMNTIEIPVTYVQCIDKKETYSDSKFDIDWLSYDELIQVVELAKKYQLRTLTLFMHSFSFIRKQKKHISVKEDNNAIFRSLPTANHYTEIYGENESNIEKFDQLLNYFSNDPEIEVLTFTDWYSQRENYQMDVGTDFIPVIDKIL